MFVWAGLGEIGRYWAGLGWTGERPCTTPRPPVHEPGQAEKTEFAGVTLAARSRFSLQLYMYRPSRTSFGARSPLHHPRNP